MNKENNEKIKNLRLSKGLSQAEFAKKLGTKQPTINMVESGKRDVPKQLIVSLNKVYGLDLLNDKQEVDEPKLSSKCIPIPFYKIGAAAGAGNSVYDVPEEDVLYFDERWLKNILGVNPKNLHLIFADGNSMDSGFNTKEDIKDRDLLMVDSSVVDGNNRIFVIMVNNSELRVKKLFKKPDGTLIISSNNSKYKEEVYNPDDTKEIEIKVIGKVVWNGSKENI